MCPACWATMLASFAGLFVASIIVLAGTDRYILPLAILLIALLALRSWSSLGIPWWAFALPIGLVAIRLASIAFNSPSKLLVHTIWKRAHAFAKRSCPRRDTLT